VLSVHTCCACAQHHQQQQLPPGLHCCVHMFSCCCEGVLLSAAHHTGMVPASSNVHAIAIHGTIRRSLHGRVSKTIS
jgi:hypothetical protein